MKKLLIWSVLVLFGSLIGNSQALKFVGSSPADGEKVSSLNNLELEFDFSDVIAKYGENELWGVGCSGFYSETSSTPEQSIRLYKGDSENGELLGRMSETMKPNNASFKAGKTFLVSFPEVYIEPGQKYTVVISYNFYAGIKGEKKWKTDTKLSYVNSPLILTFYGASETAKVLTCESNSIGENAKLEKLNEDVKLTFNHDVEVLTGASAVVTENNITVATASGIKVDPTDSKSVLVSFPETTLYNGHKYTLNVPAGIIGVAGETNVTNQEISVPFEGLSFRSFGIGRVSPANNSTTIMDNINVPFKFPVVEGSEWTYGFVNIKNAKYPMRVYKGTEENGQLVATINGEPNNTSLDFVIDFAIEPATQYTCVIDEGTVKPYAIGDPRESYLKDYISDKVVLTYTTPALADLGKLTVNCKDIKDNDVVEHLGAVSFTSPGFDYNGNIYRITDSGVSNLPGIVYDVTDGEETEVCRFKFTKLALDDLVAEINTDLYEGHKYRVVIPAKTFKVNGSNFLSRYVFNEELSVNLTGAKPVPNYTLTYAVEGQSTLVTEVAPQAEVKVSFPENDGFKVASIAFNGEQQAVGETFTTPAIAGNSFLDIAYVYAGKIDYDFTTGVTAPEDCPFTVTSEGEMLVVEGVKAGDTIRIYTAGGLMMADLGAVPAGMSRASFRLATGQVYILLVNTTALKLRH